MLLLVHCEFLATLPLPCLLASPITIRVTACNESWGTLKTTLRDNMNSCACYLLPSIPCSAMPSNPCSLLMAHTAYFVESVGGGEILIFPPGRLSRTLHIHIKIKRFRNAVPCSALPWINGGLNSSL